ncbi:MAG: hypothetical protein EOP86_20030 [Verrucomicrobiaceae bacterium]|nr:MAG: hypothetical protein EOP86_20030 [Verrucomicrobiaceae bacterium]
MPPEEQAAADEVLRDINELAITFWLMMVPAGGTTTTATATGGAPRGSMRGTADPLKTLAWDLACEAGRHLTEHDPARLLEQVLDDLREQPDFCADARASWEMAA